MTSPMPILSPASNIRPAPADLRPANRATPKPQLPSTIILGMPHLCLGGLSETWLLKECGHRHWFMLAEAVGMRVPDFRDEAGEPAYAAFTSAAIRDAFFATLCEHDELTFATTLARISRTQVVSLHQLISGGRRIGEVELTSVFVKRQKPGRNRSIARVSVQHLPPVRSAQNFGRAAGFAAAVRAERWREHFGFRREDASEQARLVVDPCPAQDFNGADFLYFAAFQAFVDRAEWAWFRSAGAAAPAALSTLARDVIYHGNIEPGDRIVVTLLASRREAETLSHWCRLAREDDGARLADVFTRRVVGVPR